MLTPIIHKRTRETLGYIRDFKPNMPTRHVITFRGSLNNMPLCFECDGRVRKRLDFIRKFGYRPGSCNYSRVVYRVKYGPLAVIVHGQREADTLMRALYGRAARTWQELRKIA